MGIPTILPIAKQLFIGHAVTKFISPLASILNANYSSQGEATFETKPYKLHRLDKGPNTKVSLNRDDALDMYTKMVTIRQFENIGNAMYKAMLIRGFLHLYSGQEAVAVGVRKIIRDKDTITGAYRIHAWAYLLGISVPGILCELTYRQTGCTRAKGGSMHMYTKRFFGGNGIVGAQMPMGTGSGLAHKLKNDGGISWVLYGDGSGNQGQGFEAMNMAKLWGLPVIYLCENNNYAMGTRADRAAANTDFYTRGDLIPGVWADGMDVLATREAARFAVEHVLNTKSPIVLEMETYRYFGHSMSDPGISYRSREEVQSWRKSRDPINNFKEKIVKAGLVTADEVKAINKKAKKEVEDAAEQAKKDPFVDISELTADIYKLCLEPEQVIRGPVPSVPLKHINIAS